jgi:thymidylate synthase
LLHSEHQYLDIMQGIVDDGNSRIDRTKVGTKAIFGVQCVFDMSDGSVPILTTKKVLWQIALKELLWFLKGETNIRPLLQEGVRIWSDWPLAKYREATGDEVSQEEFERRVLDDEAFAMQWGDLGPVYGKQWRRWRDYDGGEIDQVQRAVDLIKNDPFSRRIIIEGWNVAELSQMALTPCHKSYQFFVEENPHGKRKLSLLMSQRSADLMLGVPFNWVTSSFFLAMMAQQCDLEIGEFIWQGGDVHLYDNHSEAVRTQLARLPKAPFPKLTIKRKPEDIFSYHFEDFEVTGYEYHPFIKAEVAV